MRISLRWLMPLFFIAAALTSLADPPAKIAVPTVFSYDIPHGWTSVNIPGSSFPTAVDTVATVDGKGQAKAMITVNADTNKGNLIQWCNQSWAQNKAQFTQLGATIGEMQIFHTNVPTTSGMSATIDLTARGRAIHYTMYFFAGNGNTKLAVTCACSAADAGHYGPIFDAAMKTFVPY